MIWNVQETQLLSTRSALGVGSWEELRDRVIRPFFNTEALTRHVRERKTVTWLSLLRRTTGSRSLQIHSKNRQDVLELLQMRACAFVMLRTQRP